MVWSREGEDVYQAEIEPVLFDVSLGIGLALFFAEVVPCLLSFVDP